jgi:hypothetical protein
LGCIWIEVIVEKLRLILFWNEGYQYVTGPIGDALPIPINRSKSLVPYLTDSAFHLT